MLLSLPVGRLFSERFTIFIATKEPVSYRVSAMYTGSYLTYSLVVTQIQRTSELRC